MNRRAIRSYGFVNRLRRAVKPRTILGFEKATLDAKLSIVADCNEYPRDRLLLRLGNSKTLLQNIDVRLYGLNSSLNIFQLLIVILSVLGGSIESRLLRLKFGERRCFLIGRVPVHALHVSVFSHRRVIEVRHYLEPGMAL